MPRAPQPTAIDGILVVDKPPGKTSHDVVESVRRLIGFRQIGHLGTLDPLATGVLVLALGKATRLARFYTGRRKRYTCAVRFGFATDTYDADGEGLSEDTVPALDTEHILLGLLREGEGLAVGALETLGVPLDQMRLRVYRTMVNRVAMPESVRELFKAKSNVVACRVDDRDLDAIDALVEVGIRSTRSDAASWLIHAGIDTHKDIFESVYATVAEIRLLRTKAQAIVQQVTKSGPGALPIPGESSSANEGD